MKAPLVFCGYTPSGIPTIGGAFQMADTYGFPLEFFAEECRKNGGVCSIPHYFASALEHGWTWETTLTKIIEHLTDCGNGKDTSLVTIAMRDLSSIFHEKHPNLDLPQLGKIVREYLEGRGR